MCVGLIRADQLMRASAKGVGNPVLLVGADTGRDGMHGATFASDTLGENSLEDRPAVQVGNPFLEKCLMEACLEVLRPGVVVGMQDLGAAGLTSSAVECAARGGHRHRDRPGAGARRERGMNAYEIMLSEIQERMLVIVEQGSEDEAQRHLRQVGPPFQRDRRSHRRRACARSIDGDTLVAEIPARILADEVPDPLRRRASPTPPWPPASTPTGTPSCLPEHAARRLQRTLLMQLLAAPNIASQRARLPHLRPHHRHATPSSQPGQADAAVLRDQGHHQGHRPDHRLQRRASATSTPTRAARTPWPRPPATSSCVGAEPIAVTDCLNFGNPERPDVFYQMESAVNGIADACNALGVPVVSGNVSLYNESEGVAVLPTPVIGMLGYLENVEHRADMAFRSDHKIALLQPLDVSGQGRGPELLGASQYLETIFGKKVGLPPRVDLTAERNVQYVCRTAIHEHILDVAHDCSDGGLAIALAEMCIAGSIGATVDLSALAQTAGTHSRDDVLLFAERPSRIIVALPTSKWSALQELATATGVGLVLLGETGGDTLRISRDDTILVNSKVESMDVAWRGALV